MVLYFYQRIRDIDTGVKACFLTASETSQQEFEKGIYPIVVKEELLIRKPIQNQDLLERVKKILLNSTDEAILSKNQG